mmetsp:Transcript_26042/g.49880  ORF Transcript_26042/g.49880 Transcript_26042/m.49880 type:complete len:555 (-) Transcript_26042:27-1691(-)
MGVWHLSGYEVALLCVCASLFVAYVLVTLRSIVREQWWLLARNMAVALKAAVIRQVRKTPDESFSEFEAIISEKMWTSRFARCRFANRLFLACCVVHSAGIVINILSFVVRSNSRVQDVIFLIAFSLNLLCDILPHLLCCKLGLGVWYSLNMVLGCSSLAPGICPPMYFPTVSPFIMLLAALHSVAYMQSRVVACWTMALVALLCTSVMLNTNAEDGGGGPLQALILATNLAYGLGLCLFTAMIERSSEAQIRSDAAAFLLTEKHHASNALMRIFYDVVVELDASFMVTSNSEDCAALLHHGPGFSLRGTHFEDLLLDDEDRQIFKQRMQQPLTEDRPATADVMHVSMMRAGGDRFQVKLFNFQFRGLGGRTCHLLGIKELDGTESAAAPALAEASSWEITAARCSVAVTVDSAEEGLPVLGFTDGFKQLMPRIARPACPFANFVENENAFAMWLQRIMNAIEDSDEENLAAANAYQVRLKASGRYRCVLATCSVAFNDDTNMPQNIHSEDAIPVRLVFRDICENSSSSHRRSLKRKGTPPRSQHTHLDLQLPV